MPTDILPEFGASTAFTITLAGLASSTTGVGRQTNMVANTGRARRAHIYGKITTGTSPTAAKTIRIYKLRGDDSDGSPNIRTDNAGDADAGLTRVCAELVHTIQTTATSDQSYYFDFVLEDIGPEFGLLVAQDTVAALNATGSNHAIRYVLENDEIQ